MTESKSSKAEKLLEAVEKELKAGGRILVQHGSVVLPFKHLHKDEHEQVKSDYPVSQ